MSVSFETVKFNRVGKKSGNKVTRVVDGKEVTIYVDEQGNEIVDTYDAKQIVEGSINHTDPQGFITDALEVGGGNLEWVVEAFELGANHKLRLEAGGYSPEEKAAKALVKALGVTMDEALAAVQALKK